MRRFLVCRDGNVAMIFAICLMPLLVAIGAAVDYARLVDVRETMQNSIDATVLALSSEAASATDLSKRARKVFDVNFPAGKADIQSVSATYTRSNGANVSATAIGSVPMTFMNILGVSSKTISVSSTSNWSTQHLRVALVLDNSGSMKDNNKMTSLKTATKNLLSMLKSAAVEDGDVYVSIIPFNKDVDVDRNNYDADWLNWTDWEASSSNRTKSCDHWGNNCKTTINNHNTWTGCVTDRNKDYDIGATAPPLTRAPAPPTSYTNSYFYPEQYDDCPVKLTHLTYNWTALDTAVDAMTPIGATNQTIGLVWGWQSLVASAPLSAPSKDPNIDYLDAIILLTDGVNTKNRWDGDGGNQSTEVDARTKLACAAAKAEKISIFTVLVMAGNATLLQNCASSSDQYFKLTSASQIITTFNTIGTKLSKLRLSQ